MSTVESDVVLGALLAIEQECAAGLHRPGTAWSRQSPSLRRERSRSQVGRLVNDLHAAIASMRTLILAYDRNLLDLLAWDRHESVHELTARADMLAIMLHLDVIGRTLDGEAAHERARAMFGGRLNCFLDVSWYVVDGFGLVNEAWLRYRRLDRCAAISAERHGPETAERQMLLHCALRDAQRSMVALWSDPDFKRFITVGMALRGWNEVSTPCASIDRITRAQADREVDSGLGCSGHHLSASSVRNTCTPSEPIGVAAPTVPRAHLEHGTHPGSSL